MLYQICHGAVSFADEEILHDINFEIRNTEKIAVVGRNGCGKTTLLKLIHGDVELDKRDSDEDIFIAKAVHFRQLQPPDFYNSCAVSDIEIPCTAVPPQKTE